MQKLEELYDFRSIVVSPGDNLQEHAYKAIEDLHNNADIILIDLSFGSHKLPEEVFIGRELASHLARKFQKSAVGVYTRFPIGPRESSIISSDQFAVVLEDVRNAYEGPQNLRLQGDDWHSLFQKILRDAQSRARAFPPSLTMGYGRGITRWAIGQPRNRSVSFRRAACNLVDRALDWLDPAPTEIIISQIGEGFSGSFVVKASAPTWPKSYIVKIDEDPDKLIEEIKGYNKVRTLVNHEYYLPLLPSNEGSLVTLTPKWWGAFAMEYDGSSRPLIEYSTLTGEQLAGIYRRVWDESLSSLYGEVSIRDVLLSSIVSSEAITSASEAWNSLIRYTSRTDAFNSQLKATLDQFKLFLDSSSCISIMSNYKLKIPQVERVHGDLNCRNILYDSNKDSFRLIDFPRVGNSDCLAVDFVKAEAELVLIMMDSATGFDIDIARIAVWEELVKALSTSFELTNRSIPDVESNRTLIAVIEIREIFSKMSKCNGQTKLAYQLHLLATILPYLEYPDTTVPKKLLAALFYPLAVIFQV
jgi:hypothetical protein